MFIGAVNESRNNLLVGTIESEKIKNSQSYASTVESIVKKAEAGNTASSSGAQLLQKITNTKGTDFIKHMDSIGSSTIKTDTTLADTAKKLLDAAAAIARTGEGSLFNKGYLVEGDGTDAFTVSAVKDVDPFTLEVKQLATAQDNVGKTLTLDDETELSVGKHKVTMNVDGTSYDIFVKVSKGDTNGDVLTKLKTSIEATDAKVTVTIPPKEDLEGTVQITSKRTGAPKEGKESVFSFVQEEDENAIDVLGLNQVKETGTNAIFSYNGGEDTEHQYNSLYVDQSVYVDFNKTTEGPVSLSFTTDVSKVSQQLSNLTTLYNEVKKMVDESGNNVLGKVFKVFSDDLVANKGDLRQMGLSFDNDKYLMFNQAQFENGELDKLKSFWNGEKGLAYSLGDASANLTNYANRLNGTNRTYYGLKAKKSNAALRALLN